MSVPNFVPLRPVDVEIFHWMCGLVVALEEKSSGDLVCFIHPVVVEIFHSGSKRWTN